ncbi:peptidyl-tRNA hydrolase Pth2 [uncultured Roseobacter sp.]|uniref:peptidyl-tRNA hydrolase Pth2 n=1 Tax=uncultured Roseobacter sp. TaxID=114847 RepID=UPI002612B4B1|nr:peptidyl-tRNA hydrolase Pth2 [uncultured Roseobacter sp.]
MKQVIVVNDALRLPKGKLSAQVAHASVSAFLAAAESMREEWLERGMPKVVLKCASELELEELHSEAQTKSLPACLIRDAGKTLLAKGTITCLGIGPAMDTEIDTLTGDMALL